MLNATRFALWFRFAGRPLPTLLLAAQGLTLTPVAAQDAASDPPAAVLRVARDQPRLDTPRNSLSRRGTESSRRTTPSLTLNGPQLNTPADAPSPSAAVATAELLGRSLVDSALNSSSDMAPEAILVVSPFAEDYVENSTEGLAENTSLASAADDGWVSRGAIRQLPPRAAEAPAASVATRPSEDAVEAPRLNSTEPDAPEIDSAPAAMIPVEDLSSRQITVPQLSVPQLSVPQLSGPQIVAPEISASELTPPRIASNADSASEDSAAEISSSNARSLALQEQIERFEAVESGEDTSGGDAPRFVEIIPESIEVTPQQTAEPQAAARPQENAQPQSTPLPRSTGERMPLRDPTIPGLTARGPAAEDEYAEEYEYAGEYEDVDEYTGGDDDSETEALAYAADSGEAGELAEDVRQRSTPAPVISAAALRLKRPIEQTLQYYHQRPENSLERTPWGMLHAILPYGLDANIDAGHRRYNAIAWLAGNNACRNLKLLALTPSGRIEARTGIGLQGHQAQMLAIFAQVGVPKDYPLYVGPQRFTVADLVRSEMAACRAGEELTFTLIGLSHYMSTDATWTASDGERWDFEKLIREELQQPVVGAACGGTHRLMGLSYALAQRRREGAPITGQWERAAIYIDDFVAYAWQLQNRDGSLSTQWFEGREDNGQLDRKVQTTGHIFEWLIFNSTDDQLQDERMVRGIAFLADAMLSNRGTEWEVGPKGHALRALSLYHRRVFGSRQPWRPSQTAAASTNGRR